MNFELHKTLKDALAHSAAGGQALLLLADRQDRSDRREGFMPPKGGNKYVRAIASITPKSQAQLYDRNEERLKNTAVMLGVWSARIKRHGSRFQHIWLSGWAVSRAMRRCVNTQAETK